jgi:serine/threonine-protein kinase RsbW
MSSSTNSSVMYKQLILDSKPDVIHQVENVVDQLKNELEFKEDVYGNVMVAVTEAVNNCIVHGNKGDETKKIFVDFEIKNHYCLIIRVKDQGDGFSPDALPDPTAPENIGNIGGRGVCLMEHLADELRFEEDGRLVEMTFNI